jgi:hypothetical protein
MHANKLSMYKRIAELILDITYIHISALLHTGAKSWKTSYKRIYSTTGFNFLVRSSPYCLTFRTRSSRRKESVCMCVHEPGGVYVRSGFSMCAFACMLECMCACMRASCSGLQKSSA